MSTKVLVFESDAAFAGELRSELGKLGCATSVVDDGNVGLQQASTERPDLILLSIELPRMNGFSVCNKLKKDPSLKDVPLIIMSSESSDETFEQHKKLRTRAEDYVHKPIAFGELLEHIQVFVPLGDANPESEASIVIDDEIEIGTAEDYYADEDGTLVAERSPQVEAVLAEVAAQKPVDPDVDAFAESAFGMLTASNGAAAPGGPQASVPPPRPPAASPARRASVPPAPPPPRVTPSVKPQPQGGALGIDPAEYDWLRDELAKAREELGRLRQDHASARDEQSIAQGQATQAQRELAELRGEVDRLREEAGEAERLTKEVEDLKARLAAGPKAGAISSREFLDLREALNKKDKEILALREQLSRRDKDIVESQDKMISLERSKADLEDRSLATERELNEAKERIESLSADKDLAKKLAEDLKGRLEKVRVDLEARERQLAEAKTRHGEELAARDAKWAEQRAQAEEALAAEKAVYADQLAQEEERHRTERDQARRDYEVGLAEAREQASREKIEALGRQDAQLREEHEGKLLAFQGAQREEIERRLQEARDEADRRREEALESLRAEHALRVAQLHTEQEARVAALEQKAAGERSEAESRMGKLDLDLAVTRGELESLREAKLASDAAAELKQLDLGNRLAEAMALREELEKRLDEAGQRLAAESSRAERLAAKWESDRQSLERAKDALAVALTQIEEAETRT